MYAYVLTEIGVKNVDKYFTYIIPNNLINKVSIGSRVKIPFNNRCLEGFVLDIVSFVEDTSYEIKEIISLVDEEPILNEEMLLLGKKVKELTLCSLISAYQAMLPKALKAKNKVNMNIQNNRYLILNKDNCEVNNYINNCSYEKQKKILNDLIVNKRLLCIRVDSTIKTLLKKGLVDFVYEEKYRYNYNSSIKYSIVKLNEEQNNVVDEITNNLNKNINYLLHGVTGSGKTEVYMAIIDEVIKKGRDAIMLVPEISLTPQIIGRFKSRFGNNIAILHSRLSDAEKYDEYRKIKEGLVNIVIGARSAVFAPLSNIGVIIIDEEHANTYKQDNNPRYQTRDIAIIRGNYHNCPVIFGSATPTLESYARAIKGNYKLLELKKRPNNKCLPKVTIVDMKKEIKNNNSYLSKLLIDKIKEKLEKKEQVILLLNRRGYSSIVTCSNCGYVFKCPNCDISLTYHKTSDTLRCHYCGYGSKKNDICPECGSRDMKDYGIGTQKLEEEIKNILPTSRIVRMDLDTTSAKNSHQKIIEDFMDYKYDIIVGTQMIAKGLDFPLVTLVGIINADMSLNLPNFRSSEYTFQLLSQVSGRAGRASKEGEVIIQTYNEDHYSIALSKNHDYKSFFQTEMNIRKKLKYPPYYYLAIIRILSKDYEIAKESANKIGKYLKDNKNDDMIILGPSISNIFKVNNVYHFQCIIKYRDNKKVFELLTNIDNRYKMDNKVNIVLDIDPIRL